MKILICNVGSTSLKYQLFDMDRGEQVLATGGAERVGTEKGEFYWKNCLTGESGREAGVFPTHGEAISRMLSALEAGAVASLDEVDCVGFKVVHAKGVTGVQYLTEDVLAAMAAFSTVAPAHNPPYIAAIRQFRALLPGKPLIGAFETAFHQTLPPKAYLYPLPADLSRREGIRRYGFHGASLEYLSSWAAERMGRRDLKLICCHLGGSSSICAVENGQSVDTNLGMGLQCGVMHNNRIGDMDPYVIFHLVEACGMSLDEVKELLQKKSGFLGMSGGVSGDLRDVEAAAEAGSADCRNALESYCYQIKKYLGAYTAAMGGLDAVVFGGGIGRNGAGVRARALAGLGCLGIELDPEKNAHAAGGGDISRDGSPVRIFVVDTNEEIIVARKAQALLQSERASV
ncbi:MAG: acetate/propionate family kinase [Oscillospiraceae bacterium]|nr:acetate/propionate family kinase [Oscillospiraceae bacterium]